MKTVAYFIFFVSQISEESNWSLEIKSHLLLERKAVTKVDNILIKQRHYFANNGPYGQSVVFPVVMYGCESWSVQKAEDHRIDSFELWYWRRLLRVLWRARRSNQSTLKQISPEYSLEGLMLKLKLQYFGHLMQRTDSDTEISNFIWNDPNTGKIEGQWRRGQQSRGDD